MIRQCTRCKQPYGEALDVVSAAPSYAPFCSKRCADADLIHWLKGDYVIDGSGQLVVDDEEVLTPSVQPPQDDDEG